MPWHLAASSSETKRIEECSLESSPRAVATESLVDFAKGFPQVLFDPQQQVPADVEAKE